MMNQIARSSQRRSFMNAVLEKAIPRIGHGSKNSIRHLSSNESMFWSRYELGPPDGIVGLNEAFAKDDFPHKVNVGVGAYRLVLTKLTVTPYYKMREKKLTTKFFDLSLFFLQSKRR